MLHDVWGRSFAGTVCLAVGVVLLATQHAGWQKALGVVGVILAVVDFGIVVLYLFVGRRYGGSDSASIRRE